jgi:hypothetical protein
MANSEVGMAIKREAILNLLSDAENGKVATLEGTNSISEGNAFLDLDHLERGVQTDPAACDVTHVIPQGAVSAETWAKIVAVVTH